MKISDINWEAVRMVSITGFTLRITTNDGVFTYDFDTAKDLSKALLVLSLTGSKRVEFVDEARFNPARFLPLYRDHELFSCLSKPRRKTRKKPGIT